MTAYVLLILVWMGIHTDPQPVLAGFHDIATCQTAEGLLLTDLGKNKDVTGVAIVDECTPVPEATAASFEQ